MNDELTQADLSGKKYIELEKSKENVGNLDARYVSQC